jgi:DNA ligase-1
MRYLTLASAFEKIEKTSGYLEKNKIIASLLKETPPHEIERVVLLLLGHPWPAHVSRETGVGIQQLKKAVSIASGYSASEIEKLMREVGDMGEVTRRLLEKKRQVSLFKEQLMVKQVFDTIKGLPDITGGGSVDRKVDQVSKLLTSADSVEAKFIVRMVLGDLRMGVAEGRLRDAIATAFGVDAENVEHAYMLTTDYSLVSKAAAEGGEEGLKKLSVSVSHPVSPMLAQRAEDIQEILERMSGKAAFEIKLDGIRIQVHKNGDEIFLFTRRMEDYTSMFPDLISPLKEALKPKRAIVDGELVAIDTRTGKPMPFQEVLKRRRKYDVKETAKQIPVEITLFDILLADNKVLMDETYTRRRAALEKAVKPGERVNIVEKRVLTDAGEIKELSETAVKMGHEGLLAKDLNSSYRAGRREFVWMKLKPTLETLDLAVVGALYGKGKRAGLFGSYVLAAIDEDGRYKTVTKCGSGFTDDDLKELMKVFKNIQLKKPHPDVDIEIECDVYFEPKIVFEILYEEVQVSPAEKHTGGYGLRFPRYVRMREDKSPEESNTVDDIYEIYSLQERRKSKSKGKI